MMSRSSLRPPVAKLVMIVVLASLTAACTHGPTPRLRPFETHASENDLRRDLNPIQSPIGDPNAGYLSRLGEVLFPNEAESESRTAYVQMITVPAFGGEELVFVDAEDEPKHPNPYTVVHVRIATEGGLRAVREGDKVGTVVKRAPLSRETFLVLNRVWLCAAAHARYESSVRTKRDGSQYAVLDGTTYHFATFQRGVGWPAAIASSPGKGTPGWKLAHVGKLLAELADSSPEKQPELERQLASSARTLFTDLDRLERDRRCESFADP